MLLIFVDSKWFSVVAQTFECVILSVIAALLRVCSVGLYFKFSVSMKQKADFKFFFSFLEGTEGDYKPF